MSEFRFACPHCGQRISGDASYMGRQVTCPSCQQTINVPAPKAKAPVASSKAPPPPSQTDAGEAASTEKTSGLAIASLVCSTFFAFGSVPGIICGHLARIRIRRDTSLGGNGLATAGLIISYSCLLISIAFFTAGFILLGPNQGRQLSAKEKAANTPAVLEARRVDEVKIADPASEADHKLRTRNTWSGEFLGKTWRGAQRGSYFSYVMKVEPNSPMSLFCTYWGNDSFGRFFDIVVDDEVIATQNLEFNDPGHFFDVEYKIPVRLTRGKSEVTVVFQARPGRMAGGLYGCQMLKR